MAQKAQLIVSLTTFSKRINTVHLVIASLLKQSVKPDKIILYLSLEEFPNKEIPSMLSDMQCDKFEIHFVKENLKSYKKLIYALKEYPDADIITVDDDVIYPRNLVKSLMKAHRKRPSDICANRIREINIQNDTIMPYTTWRLSERRKLFGHKVTRKFSNVQIGVGGVLYPKHSLHKDVFKEKIFTKACEYQDDIWFWAMAVHNGTHVSATKFGCDISKSIESTQKYGLFTTINSRKNNPNDAAIRNILKLYPDVMEKIMSDFKNK